MIHKRHLLMYYDKQFQKDPHFPLIAFNHEQMKESTTVGYLTAERKSFHDITNRLMNVNLKVLSSVATVKADVFQKQNGIIIAKKLGKVMRIFYEIGHIKSWGVTLWSEELDQYFPCYQVATTLAKIPDHIQGNIRNS